MTNTPPRILIVNDSAFQRRQLADTVEKFGYEPYEAENGAKALLSIGKVEPDCILSDLIMPKLGGLELMEHLTNLGHRLPVVIVGQEIPDPVRDHCLEIGAMSVLQLPVELEELKDAIFSALMENNQPTEEQS